MNQNVILNLRFVSIFFAIVLNGILSKDANAQSAFMMKYLPKDPTLLEKIEVPKGISRCVMLEDKIWNDKIKTDTVSINTYDSLGRDDETVFFSEGKRESHYFCEYPNANTKKFYTIMKVDSKLSVRNYDENVIDAAGNFIDASSYQVTNAGDTIMVNDHDYVYDDSRRLIYQCDQCNLSMHIKRYFRYKGNTLIRLYETSLDTLQTFYISDMVYDQDGRMTRYTYRNIFKGDTNLNQDCLYTYENGRLVRQLQFNYFEKVWREYVYLYDSLGRVSQSYQIIETDTITIAYYFEGDRLMSSFLTTTFQYSEGYVFFGNKFRESFDGKDHTTETRYTYDKDGHRTAIEQYWDGVLRRRYRNLFE